MEVGTDQQFEFLRNWQQKVYENGYVGMSGQRSLADWAWIRCFRTSPKAMAKHRVPFLLNTIGLNWAGRLFLPWARKKKKAATLRA